jgi:hypothetical protein
VPTAASEDGGALGEAAMAGATGRRHRPTVQVFGLSSSMIVFGVTLVCFPTFTAFARSTIL